MKDAQALSTGSGQGRWDPSSNVGKVYNDRYTKPRLLDALSEWEAIANEALVSKAALAYRWVTYNSKLSAEHGDGIIVRIPEPHASSSEAIWCQSGVLFPQRRFSQVPLLKCMLIPEFTCRSERLEGHSSKKR